MNSKHLDKMGRLLVDMLLLCLLLTMLALPISTFSLMSFQSDPNNVLPASTYRYNTHEINPQQVTRDYYMPPPNQPYNPELDTTTEESTESTIENADEIIPNNTIAIPSPTE